MKIKERERSGIFIFSKKILKTLQRIIFNRKTKILLAIIIILGLLLIGTLFGLLAGGFFGTFDRPSQRAIDLLHFLGLTDLRGLKTTLEGIKNENIKIAINFMKGKLSKPEKIIIDIGFTDFQKLEYKRQQALEQGILISSAEDYVPAQITHNGKTVNAKIRLKGDWTDHLKGEKWSFRIKIRDQNTLFNMKTLSIQDPKTRNYLYEWVYLKALLREDVLAPRYEFVEVIINGEKKGIYALEEHFEKELIENNKRREGVILKFNEDVMWEETLRKINYTNEISLDYNKEEFENYFYNSNIETFDDDKILENPDLLKQFNEAKNLLESFRKGSLKTSEVFDVDKLSKYFAISTMMKAWHATEWHNIRFYYNPINSRLEPIGFDADINDRKEMQDIINQYTPSCISYALEVDCSDENEIASFHELVFRDREFFEKYMQELEKFSQKEYLNELFSELEKEIEKNKNIIHKDYPLNYFDTEFFYNNQEQILSILNPPKSVNAYFDEGSDSTNKVTLNIANINQFPLEVVEISYNNSEIFYLAQPKEVLQPKKSAGEIKYEQFVFTVPNQFIIKEGFSSNLKVGYKISGLNEIYYEGVFPWKYLEEEFQNSNILRQESNVANFDFLLVDHENKNVLIRNGKWVLNQSLIIPKDFSITIEKGTTIDLIKGSAILSYSDLQLLGTNQEPINIISSDKTGQGIAVLNAEKTSIFNNVIITGLRNPSKGNWELTGAVTFYKSPATLENVFVRENNAEDSLNFIESDFELENVFFEMCSFDCLDSDFSVGSLESSTFVNCGNDCLDFSGTNALIKNIKISGFNDKGVSIGEKSNIIAEDLEIQGGGETKNYIALASKDQSKIFISGGKISNVEYGIVVYQKKPEFGPSSAESVDLVISNSNTSHIIEKDSSLIMDKAIILGSEENLYGKLYPI